jgi:uncharacterized protein (TIGR04255 family)
MSAAAARAEGAARPPIPRKLKDDAILEAVCQIQFKTSEVPELVIGRLTLEQSWKDFKPNRLPAADIPRPIRNQDANLRFAPTFELRRPDGARVIRLNDNLISYHIIGVNNYCGWSQFKPELEGAVAALFEQLKGVEITRLTLRYINALNEERHRIGVVHDLDLQLMVGGMKVLGPVNINFTEERGRLHTSTTRIAHPEFVQGELPKGTCAIVDVEVTSPPQFSAKQPREVLDWIESAHTYEKEAFFKLIPSEVLSHLTEE